MKVLTVLSLLLVSRSFAKTYKECTNCKVVTEEDGVKWGIQNKEWCTINTELCDENAEKNKCFSFPKYLCCEGCEVKTEDESGKWGIENGHWCGIKDSCFKKVEERPLQELENRMCQNAVVTDMYTADPAPLVVGDTLYVYTTHDEDVLVNDFYTMRDWYVFSTKDMVNWTNHGPVLSLDDIDYAVDRAWAPQAIERNGKYYLYFPVQKKGENGADDNMAIGVATADSPVGPFKDVLGKPLIDELDWVDFDPTVFIDDDGQAYLYFGNPELRYVKLNEDMISYDEEVGIVHTEMTVESFGEGPVRDGVQTSTYGEGPWIYKRNDIYYMVFAGFRKDHFIEYIGYSTSDSPTGPWTYGGPLIYEDGGVFTIHPAIVDFMGKSFLFYHNGNLPGGGDFHRNIAYTEFEFNEDGSINPIPRCPVELTEINDEETENVTADIEEETEDSEESEEETEEVEERECQNAIVTDMFTADPAPLVVGDTLYVYTTHDEDELINNFYTMRDWYVFSTKDMVNWEKHGPILSLDDIDYAVDRAWAPQAIERNGKFYLYFPVQKKGENGADDNMAIGVATADSPVGPFKDVLGKPLIDELDWVDFDPTVFIDDDGQAYLYFGNPELRYVKLNEDMISYDEEVGIVHTEMTVEGFGEKASEDIANPTSYGEGPWLYKRNDIYYMVFAGFRKEKKGTIEYLGYSTSDSPTGPWTYGGTLMTEEGGIFTVHPGIVDFNGKTYLFYHNGNLPGGGEFQRNVAFTEFEFNEDGSIDPVERCKN